jgi:2-polyprenyl-3-methyl-5-hydroxy-6-metoxy-1,4-benzoquinol methylase
LPFKYDYHHIDLGVDNAHTRVIRLIGTGKHVLELGCATGYMAKVLVERLGCTVVGVERDPEAAEQARKVCSRLIVGDIESLDFARELGEARFDVILCADVLEHLREPVRVLAAVRALLAPDGYVVASIPNIGHVAVIAELLEGRFPYGSLGLLDETHLRFFTRHSIYDCFERSGFLISHLECLQLEPEATEFHTDLSRVPAEVARFLRSREDGTAYQFVLTASPVPSHAATDAMREALARRPQGAAEHPNFGTATSPPFDAAHALFEGFLGRMKFLEVERDRQGRRLEELRGEVDAQVRHVHFLEDEVSQREERARQHVERLEHHVRLLEEETAALKARQAALEASAGWRLLECLRRWRSALMARRPREGGKPLWP